MSSNAQKAQEQYELYQYCRVEGGHDSFLRHSEEAKRYYASQQWAGADMRSRTAEGRLSFVVNEVFRTVNAIRGELNQLSSDVRFDPTNGDPEVAKVLNRLSEHTDRENKMFMHNDRVILDGLLSGRGFWRQRIRFDDNMQGQVVTTRQRPENTVLDFDLRSPDPATWARVFTTEVVSDEDIVNMWGKQYKDDFAHAPYADWLELEDRSLAMSLGGKMSGMDELSFLGFKRHRLINHQFRDYKYKDCFVDKQTGDFTEIPENWEREKIAAAIQQFDLGTMRRRVKTLRWRVTCNNVVLHDEDSPYKYFDVVPYFPWFLDDMPLSLFSVLRGPQDLLNYTVSEETLILGTTAHAGWKIKQGSLKNMTARELEKKGSKTGVVLELEDVEDAVKILPGQPASGFQQFGDRARGWINDLGSVTPSMLGVQRADANGQNIQGSLSRAPVNLHAPLVAFQFSMQLLAERKLDLFQTYYTETRIMRVAASSYGQTEELAINAPDAYGKIANDLSVGKYTVRLLPVGSRQAADEMSFDQLMLMKEAGVTVPNSLLVATSAINAKSDVIEQLLAANSGEVSPEEQRMREIEMERAELDLVDAEAGIDAKHAASELARGRADRAVKEAAFDNRLERARLDRDRLMSEHDRSLKQMDLQREGSEQKTAVALTKIAADAAKPKGAPKTPLKPPTKQPR